MSVASDISGSAKHAATRLRLLFSFQRSHSPDRLVKAFITGRLSARRRCDRAAIAGPSRGILFSRNLPRLSDDSTAGTRHRSRTTRRLGFLHVRFTPRSGHVQRASPCLLWAKSGHRYSYSITSSARASSAGGTVRPRLLAVLRLITSSYLVGACTGRSAGFSPLRIRSTYLAAPRH